MVMMLGPTKNPPPDAVAPGAADDASADQPAAAPGETD
jgi:hypothetical protein